MNSEHALKVYEDRVCSLTARELPQQMYHVDDITRHPIPDEAKGSYFARALGFSLLLA